MNRLNFLLPILFVCIFSTYATGCGDNDDSHSNMAGIEWLSQGGGAENELSLTPMQQGWRKENNVVEGAIKLPNGNTALRYNTPDYWPSLMYVSSDENGHFLHGSITDGILENPILLAPAKVKVGMKWRVTPGKNHEWLEFEVVETKTLDTPVGQRAIWAIRMVTEGGAVSMRYYAEGIGLIVHYPGLTSHDRIKDVQDNLEFELGRDLFIPLHDRMPDIEPEVERVELTAIDDVFNSNPYFWIESVQTRQESDMESDHKLKALTYCDHNNRMICDYDIFLKAEMEGVRLSAVNEGIVDDDSSKTDIIDWYDPHGEPHSPESIQDGTYHYKLPVMYTHAETGNIAHLRFMLRTGEWSWIEHYKKPDGTGFQQDRHILMGPRFAYKLEYDTIFNGDYRDIHTPNFIGLDKHGVIRHWHIDDDQFSETALSGFLSGELHIGVTPERTERLITTYDGYIDRLIIEHDGVQRERLGAVKLPEGHVLTGVAPLNLIHPDRAPKYLVFTNIGRTFSGGMAYSRFDMGETHAWMATLSGDSYPMYTNIPTSVDVEFQGFDARICWPPTDEPLTQEGWLLGDVAPAAIIPSGPNCATLIRDLTATPFIDAPTWFNQTKSRPNSRLPLGWTKVEGPIPGLGHTLLHRRDNFFEQEFLYEHLATDEPLLYADDEGNFVTNTRFKYRQQETDGTPIHGHRVTQYDAGGILLGSAYLHYLHGSDIPHTAHYSLVDEARNGIWRTYKCDDAQIPYTPCEPQGWGIAFVGHEATERFFIPTPTFKENPLEDTEQVYLDRLLDNGLVIARRSANEFYVADESGRFEPIEIPNHAVTYDYNNQTFAPYITPNINTNNMHFNNDLSYCGVTVVAPPMHSNASATVFYCSDASGENLRYEAHVSKRFDHFIYWGTANDGFIIVKEYLEDGAVEYQKLDLESFDRTPYDMGSFKVDDAVSPFETYVRQSYLERITGTKPLILHKPDNTLWHVRADKMTRVELSTDANWRAFLELPDDRETTLREHLHTNTDRILLLTGHVFFDDGIHHNNSLFFAFTRVPYNTLEIVEVE